MDSEAPWKLAKQEGEEKRLETVLWTLAESIRVISILICPFLPETSLKIRGKIGLPADAGVENAEWGHTEPGTSVVNGENLFSRIKEEENQ